MRIYEEIETNQVFGAPEIERVLKCSTSTAKNVMKKLREIGVVEEVKGKGKGKYTFISCPNGLLMSFRVWIILPSHAMIIKKLEETNTNTIT